MYKRKGFQEDILRHVSSGGGVHERNRTDQFGPSFKRKGRRSTLVDYSPVAVFLQGRRRGLSGDA